MALTVFLLAVGLCALVQGQNPFKPNVTQTQRQIWRDMSKWRCVPCGILLHISWSWGPTFELSSWLSMHFFIFWNRIELLLSTRWSSCNNWNLSKWWNCPNRFYLLGYIWYSWTNLSRKLPMYSIDLRGYKYLLSYYWDNYNNYRMSNRNNFTKWDCTNLYRWIQHLYCPICLYSNCVRTFLLLLHNWNNYDEYMSSRICSCKWHLSSTDMQHNIISYSY